MRQIKRSHLLYLVFIFFSLSLSHYLGWLKPFENFLRGLINPGLKTVYQWTTVSNNNPLTRAQCQQSVELYQAALVDQVQFKLLQEENNKLKEQLNFIQNQNYNTIGARVIGKSIEPVRNTIIIDQGQKAGLMIGQPVIVGVGVLAGKIIRTEDYTAIVQLIRDHQSRVAASVMNGEKSIGIVEGGYGISTRLNFIPQNETVHIGDSVITSGLEIKIPRGLLIGTVEAVEKEAHQPFQRAVVNPLADLDRITVVSVLTGKPQ